MRHALVIADDLTGAAEIAGVGHRFGLSAHLIRSPVDSATAELTVIDTDSRALAADAAAAAVERFIARLNLNAFDLIFKKMDSVLRGPVRTEVLSVLSRTGLSRALLAPQNPSRGRTIVGGVYRIDGVPLDQTPFRDDPDHPARSALAAEVLQVRPDDPIAVADADSVDRLGQLARSLDRHTLPVGGADFFQAILECRGRVETRPFMPRLPPGPTLFVCGSASAYSRELLHLAQRHGVTVQPMPDDLRNWPAEVVERLQSGHRVLMTIDRPVDRAPGASVRLQAQLTDAVARVLVIQPITNLLVDGGATAASICQALGYSQFHVTGELAPGAVMLRTGQMNLAIKPGSYRWPDGVFEPCAESR